ncbi:hypothetical protein AAFF_G00151650 [Aldrovandia affinis]|uniref:Uncharacterized protein n=1 Tax=Aldrovandia affinis TaxID=143900 RepID=A0AAD7W8R8_9TELE|nr:hypothetical protein AAFF_G00151650 [Aldrovandia affinis]
MDVYVVEGLSTPLLSRPAATALQLVARLEDVSLWRALSRLQEAGVTLNDKCEFSKSRIKFLGQIIEASGISADPDKVSAVRAMKEPSNISESNGEAERAVRTIKGILKKSSDPYLGLMAYRAAPLANGHSPTELLMGRKIRTTVPVIPSQLNPACADIENLKRKEQRYRQKQQQNYNRRHRAHDMPHLQPSDHVWVKDMLQRGTVVSTADTLRSYLIETPRGTL